MKVQSEVSEKKAARRRASNTRATSRTASPDGQDQDHPPAYTESYVNAPSKIDHLESLHDSQIFDESSVPDGVSPSDEPEQEHHIQGKPPTYTPAGLSTASQGSGCDLIPQRTAVWFVKGEVLKISALAATVLLSEGVLENKDLLAYSAPSAADPGPSDPLTGILTATSRTLSGVLGGVADYPLAMRQVAQADPANRQKEIESFAKDGNKGVSRIVETALKAPMEYTTGISQGFNNMSKLWGDDTVRQAEPVTDVKSGLMAGGMGLGFGIWDGLTGLVAEPVKGAQSGGIVGAVGGLLRGIGGVVTKPIAGAVGLPANTLKGIHEEYHKSSGMESKPENFAALMQQGWQEFGSSSPKERSQVLAKWYQLQSMPS